AERLPWGAFITISTAAASILNRCLSGLPISGDCIRNTAEISAKNDTTADDRLKIASAIAAAIIVFTACRKRSRQGSDSVRVRPIHFNMPKLRLRRPLGDDHSLHCTANCALTGLRLSSLW